jgi:hypothetical protein
MFKYFCEGFRPVEAESSKEAAAIFADRLARRQHPSNPYSIVRLNSWSADHAQSCYQASVGYYDKKTKTAVVGQEWLTVSTKKTITIA